jgi:D-alanyl-D-alanine carboxypeptidase
MMTLRARALGMSRTTFRNASGLPDPEQITTARDLAVLGRHLIQDFPVYYSYFSTPRFLFHGRIVLNHDTMLLTYPGADGIKTGYTEASGCNIVTSAVRGDTRLIGVVLGASHSAERDAHMTVLLDAAFEQMGAPPAAPRREVTAFAHLPSLIGAAQAATLSQTPSQAASGRLTGLAALDVPRPRPAVKWTVQVGAFATQSAAREAATNARRVADVGDVHLEFATARGKAMWRAQLGGLSEAEARGACAALARKRIPCATLRPDIRQVASRL